MRQLQLGPSSQPGHAVTTYLPVALVYQFEKGASLHGNWEGCLQAERLSERFVGGQPCPQRCGSIIRYRVGRPQEESVAAHEQNPKACRKHPRNRKGRRRRGRVSPASSQVPPTALQH
jgi:hypothetical protein